MKGALLGQTDGFYVEDDGPGIPPADRDRVFEEGVTTAADNDGTGLGLAFVRKLADVYPEDDLTAYEISTQVNSTNNDDPSVIEPLGHDQAELSEFGSE